MTTTELIKLLKEHEKGASGRSRNISFNIKRKRTTFLYEPNIEYCSSGDGICGAELCLLLTEQEVE